MARTHGATWLENGCYCHAVTSLIDPQNPSAGTVEAIARFPVADLAAAPDDDTRAALLSVAAAALLDADPQLTAPKEPPAIAFAPAKNQPVDIDAARAKLAAVAEDMER